MSHRYSTFLRRLGAAGLLWAASPGALAPAWAATSAAPGAAAAPTPVPAGIPATGAGLAPASKQTPPTAPGSALKPAPLPGPSGKPAPALGALLREAGERHPALRLARQRYEAARARVAGEGLRPDPMVEAGVMSLRSLMGPQLTVAQTFPLGDKLAAARQQAVAEAEVARWAYLVTLNELRAEIKRTYHELYALQQTEALVERNKQLLSQMSRLASARYAVGQGKQSDVLRANTQLAELLHEALLIRQQRESASAKLQGMVSGKPSADGAPGIEGAIPTPASGPFPGPANEWLAAAEQRNPALLQARAEIAAGEAALAAARTVGLPEVTTKLGVAQSFMNMGWETVVTGMVGGNLPVESRKREAAAVAAAEWELAARRTALENQRREIAVGIHQALTQARHLQEQQRLYAQGLLPQARQALQSELANYQVGRSNFDAVLTAQMNLFRYERDQQQALADQQKMQADLDALSGQDLPLDQEAP